MDVNNWGGTTLCKKMLQAAAPKIFGIIWPTKEVSLPAKSDLTNKHGDVIHDR